MKTYLKSIVPLLGAIFMFVEPWLVGQQTFTTHDWINVAALTAGAVVAYVVANTSSTVGEYAKETGVALTAGLVVLNNVVDGGITQQELWQIVVAVLVALGVIAAPSAPKAVLPGSGQMGDHEGGAA